MQTKDNAHFHIVLVKGWVEKDGKYLLAQRSAEEVHAAGMWSLPGGKVDTEEKQGIIQDTLAKEIQEEVGVDIHDDISLVYNNLFHRVDNAPVVSMTFLCKHKSGDAVPLEDTAAVEWYTLEELSALSDIPSFLKLEIEELRKHVNKE